MLFTKPNFQTFNASFQAFKIISDFFSKTPLSHPWVWVVNPKRTGGGGYQQNLVIGMRQWGYRFARGVMVGVWKIRIWVTGYLHVLAGVVYSLGKSMKAKDIV